MSQKDIIHHIINGMLPEYSKSIITFDPEDSDDLLDIAKRIERGLIGEKAETSETSELKSIIRDLKDALKAVSGAGREA